VSGSGDGTVRLWDTEPLRVRYQARRQAEALRPEAERLVEQLFCEKKEPAKVVAAVRADGSLSESLRQAALRAVLQRTLRPEAKGEGRGLPQTPRKYAPTGNLGQRVGPRGLVAAPFSPWRAPPLDCMAINAVDVWAGCRGVACGRETV
jgi:hypothetical protein